MAPPIALRRLAVGTTVAVIACAAFVVAGEPAWLGAIVGTGLALGYALLDWYVRSPAYAQRMAPLFPIRVSATATVRDTAKLVAVAVLVVLIVIGLFYLGSVPS